MRKKIRRTGRKARLQKSPFVKGNRLGFVTGETREQLGEETNELIDEGKIKNDADDDNVIITRFSSDGHHLIITCVFHQTDRHLIITCVFHQTDRHLIMYVFPILTLSCNNSLS